MHSTQGKCYSVGEYESLLAQTGFVNATCQNTVADRGVMTATRAPLAADASRRR
jgi:hypothetical protein